MEVVGRDDDDAQGIAVGAVEEMAVVILAEAIAVGAVEEMAVVILAEAPLAAEERGGGFPFAVHVAKFFRVGGAINPVVVRPEQVVGRTLRVSEEGALGIGFHAVIGGDNRFLVGFAVAVGVAPKSEFGRRAHENPVADEREGAGQNEVIDEHFGFVVAAVAVAIGQDHDAADGGIFAVAVEIGHITAHLDDPHAAVGPEGHRDRILHERLSGGDFEFETGHEREGFERLLGRERRRGRNFIRGHERDLGRAGFISVVADLSEGEWRAAKKRERKQNERTLQGKHGTGKKDAWRRLETKGFGSNQRTLCPLETESRLGPNLIAPELRTFT